MCISSHTAREHNQEKRNVMSSLFDSRFERGQIALAAGSRLLVIALLALMGLGATEKPASAQAWSLTKAQRQAYLTYYAPVILKRGDENNSKEGRDWLTNYDFDQDGDFSNNRLNWRNINQYVAASANGPSYYDRWRIRPTLYTSLLEYMEGGSKSLVLLYHVYNAADKDASEIHDWERVEIVVRGITGTPGGSGELVNHVTVTLHKEHHIRRYYDTDLNFMQTATGKHVLLWQADESNYEIYDYKEPHGHELHFVKNPYSWIVSQMNSYDAKVNISSKDDKRNVHYVFVPEGSSSAVSTWGARPLSYTTASTQASRVDNGNTVKWYQVKRLTYELQDLADIIPTHWQYNAWYVHWLSSDSANILLESPIMSEAGALEVSAGLQLFYTKSRDSGNSNLTDGREGIPSKNWFFGSYSAEINPEYPSGADDFKGFEGLGTDSYGLTRGAASGYYASHGSYWWQHDYFVHSGAIVDADTREAGNWLTGEWYTAANGGFDGRWVQLFDDRPGYEPIAPLSLTITYPYNQCTYQFWITASARGGQAPYTFTWTNAYPYSAPSDANNSAYVDAYTTATVTVESADGQTGSTYIYLEPYCTNQEPYFPNY
jgi:hypothetical protein